MKATDATTERLWRIAEPVCVGAGYELVDMALVQSPQGWVLRLFIDHLEEASNLDEKGSVGDAAPGDGDASGVVEGSRISFVDCERLSRELGPVLDVEDPIGHAYELEVSSPGLDRPLRTIGHFERFLGQQARIVLGDGLAGRRNFKGTLCAVHRSVGEKGSPVATSPDGTAPEGTTTATTSRATDSTTTDSTTTDSDSTTTTTDSTTTDSTTADSTTTDSTTTDSTVPSSSDETVSIVLEVDGVEYKLPYRDIVSARLVPNWDALFGTGKGQSPGKLGRSPR